MVCHFSKVKHHPPHVCNTGCVNKRLWATLDLPGHFAARIDKEGGGWLQVGGLGESQIANLLPNRDSCVPFLNKVRNTTLGECYFRAEGMK